MLLTISVIYYFNFSFMFFGLNSMICYSQVAGWFYNNTLEEWNFGMWLCLWSYISWGMVFYCIILTSWKILWNLWIILRHQCWRILFRPNFLGSSASISIKNANLDIWTKYVRVKVVRSVAVMTKTSPHSGPVLIMSIVITRAKIYGQNKEVKQIKGGFGMFKTYKTMRENISIFTLTCNLLPTTTAPIFGNLFMDRTAFNPTAATNRCAPKNEFYIMLSVDCIPAYQLICLGFTDILMIILSRAIWKEITINFISIIRSMRRECWLIRIVLKIYCLFIEYWPRQSIRPLPISIKI